MSVVNRVMQRKNRSFSTTVVSIALGLLALLFVVRYGQELFLEHDLLDQSAVQRRDNNALKDENARLEAGLQYYQSRKYVEQRAREDLNLRRPDEEVLIPTGGDTSTAAKRSVTPGPNAGDTASRPPDAPANWQRWFNLFESPPESASAP